MVLLVTFDANNDQLLMVMVMAMVQVLVLLVEVESVIK